MTCVPSRSHFQQRQVGEGHTAAVPAGDGVAGVDLLLAVLVAGCAGKGSGLVAAGMGGGGSAVRSVDAGRYSWKEDLQADLAAGITVGVMLVPQVPRLLRILFCFVRIECPLALGKRVPPNLLPSPMIAKWYKCNFLENCVLERSCS
jgi:hypothetical protein